MSINRRSFLKALGAAPAGLVSFPSIVKADTSAQHVVVVGGGFAGATVAKYLRIWSGNQVEVTLIDPKAQHTSCVMSNLVLNKRVNLRELQIGYEAMAQRYGVKVLQNRVVAVDGKAQQVKLNNGTSLGYDKLVVAAGIGFQKVTGLDYKKIPHAWIAGSQTNLLKKQLSGLAAGNTFVMSVPKAPYRCPPGPYERACVVADMLKRKGGGKVIVLDENSGIQAEKHTFSRAFDSIYSDIIDYRTNASIVEVDSTQRIVYNGVEEIKADVLNIIPNQKANGLLIKTGLTGGGLWAPVDPVTYESTLSEFSGVYIIGDAQATGQPKSAHMANSQAKICADAVLRSLYNVPTHTEERLQNITTNSACYSPITYNEASWLTANFAYDQDSKAMALTHIGEAEKWSSKNYKQMFTWASNLFTDSFY
jgi:sulfide dehydrogenase [flavocytochrome c] flavoprotein subunit